MIDYPQGKTELALVLFFESFSGISDDIEEIYEAGCERIKELLNKKYGFLIRIGLVLMVLFLGIYIYNYINEENTVVVSTDNGKEITYKEYVTKIKRVDRFFEENNIEIAAGLDRVNVNDRTQITDGLNIKITKGIECSLLVDGQCYYYKSFPPIKTEDVLNYFDITLDDMDLINFELDEELSPGDEIVVNRVKIEYEVEREEIPYEVKYQKDTSLTIGKTKVKTKGKKGIKEDAYIVVYIDGKEKSRTLTSSETIQKKKDKVISYGTHILSGAPKDLKYKKKLTHVRAVSYNFKGQRRGAYGKKCKYGTCAVDKSVIPLGTKLYIEGYGYAIANDVGSGIKGKEVDLYMEKLSQCGIWGARWTTVYILD